MTNNHHNFIQIFKFVEDKRKSGRVLSEAKVGGVYMSRLIINPRVTTGNYYHKKTMQMFYVEKGHVAAAFENVNTKEKKVTTMSAGRHIVHVPSYVALATKNIGKTKAVLVFFSNRPLRGEEDSFPYTVM